MTNKKNKQTKKVAQLETSDINRTIVEEATYLNDNSIQKEMVTSDSCTEDKPCCKPSYDCPDPKPGCCDKCPPTTCAKAAELRAKYKELDDDFNNNLNETNKPLCSIAGCPICTKTILVIIFVLLLIYIFASN